MKNPALRKEKRYEPAPVIPLKQDGSLLDWLHENKRIIYREEKEEKIIDIELADDEEIADLIDAEDDDFDADFEDIGLDIDEEPDLI